MSSYREAKSAAEHLKACIERRGVKVSIELQLDVNDSWQVAKKLGVISHHTASYARQGRTPCLALVKRGRSDVPGPLANGYGGRDLVYRIITVGKANHAGRGGPLKLAGRIPANYGNSLTWGTEYEGGYEDWPSDMREFMARSNAGILDHFGWTADAHAEHSTWAPTRKIDRIHYTLESGRREIITLGRAPAPKPAPKPKQANPWAGKNPGAKYTPGSRTVRLYDAGTDVRFIQERIGVSPADGYFGPQSAAKLREYQKKRSLSPTGMADAATWNVIFGKVAPSQTRPNGRVILKLDGNLGYPTIKRLQAVMDAKSPGKAGGLGTDLTEKLQRFLNTAVKDEVIKRLTGSSRLSEDGELGPKTIKVLQYLLYVRFADVVLRREYRASDVDGILGKETVKLLQFALNRVPDKAKKF